MVFDRASIASDDVDRADRRPFTLRPFRGLRFDPETVGDLGTVVSPPYDVLDADTVRDLEAANRRNIVRLILSRRFERPYLAVRQRLHKWRDKSFLRADEDPALYLYEYTVDDTTVRGLIGVVGLRPEEERVILPHEGVMEGPVDDRTVLMRTTETNLEPILLVHEGTRALREVIATASQDAPVADFEALDGSEHRLWTVTDPTLQAAIAEELSTTQALIADGHHRYAAYLRLQEELREADAPPDTSPWDFGLAMIVDQHDHPLRVGPIHRSVAALTMSDLSEISADRGDDFRTAPDREGDVAEQGPRAPARWASCANQAARANARDRVGFVVSDGRAWALRETGRTSPVDAAVLH